MERVVKKPDLQTQVKPYLSRFFRQVKPYLSRFFRTGPVRSVLCSAEAIAAHASRAAKPQTLFQYNERMTCSKNENQSQ